MSGRTARQRTREASPADGTEVPMDAVNVRATEYTVGEQGPEAMPAVLPPQSGYTYCVELAVEDSSLHALPMLPTHRRTTNAEGGTAFIVSLAPGVEARSLFSNDL